MTAAVKSIISSTDTALTPAGQRAGADQGDPQISVQEILNDGTTQTGVWECTPGGWPVTDRPDTEIATILSGSGVITDADGITNNMCRQHRHSPQGLDRPLGHHRNSPQGLCDREVTAAPHRHFSPPPASFAERE